MPSLLMFTATKTETTGALTLLHNRTYKFISDRLLYEGSLPPSIDPDTDWRVFLHETGPGNTASLGALHKLATAICPNVALFIGCCGGFPENSDTGDLVVAETSIYIDYGKESPRKNSIRPKFMTADFLLIQGCRLLRDDTQWVSLLGSQTPNSPFDVKIGQMVCGEKVRVDPDSEALKYAVNSYPKALGVEMEGYGFYDGAKDQHIPALLVKGVSDLLSNKDYLGEQEETRLQEDAALKSRAFGMKLVTTGAIRKSEQVNSSNRGRFTISVEGGLYRVALLRSCLQRLCGVMHLTIKETRIGSVVMDVETEHDLAFLISKMANTAAFRDVLRLEVHYSSTKISKTRTHIADRLSNIIDTISKLRRNEGIYVGVTENDRHIGIMMEKTFRDAARTPRFLPIITMILAYAEKVDAKNIIHKLRYHDIRFESPSRKNFGLDMEYILLWPNGNIFEVGAMHSNAIDLEVETKRRREYYHANFRIRGIPEGLFHAFPFPFGTRVVRPSTPDRVWA